MYIRLSILSNFSELLTQRVADLNGGDQAALVS